MQLDVVTLEFCLAFALDVACSRCAASILQLDSFNLDRRQACLAFKIVNVLGVDPSKSSSLFEDRHQAVGRRRGARGDVVERVFERGQELEVLRSRRRG